MTTIENKETNLFISEDVKLKYSDLLASVLNQPVRDGITLKQMKADLATFAKVENAKDEKVIEFDDEEIKKIKSLTENHLWSIKHPAIVEFGDYIDSL